MFLYLPIIVADEIEMMKERHALLWAHWIRIGACVSTELHTITIIAICYVFYTYGVV